MPTLITGAHLRPTGNLIISFVTSTSTNRPQGENAERRTPNPLGSMPSDSKGGRNGVLSCSLRTNTPISMNPGRISRALPKTIERVPPISALPWVSPRIMAVRWRAEPSPSPGCDRTRLVRVTVPASSNLVRWGFNLLLHTRIEKVVTTPQCDLEAIYFKSQAPTFFLLPILVYCARARHAHITHNRTARTGVGVARGGTDIIITSVGEALGLLWSPLGPLCRVCTVWQMSQSLSFFELPIQPAMVILFISGVWSRESTVGYLPGRAIVYGLILLNRDHED